MGHYQLLKSSLELLSRQLLAHLPLSPTHVFNPALTHTDHQVIEFTCGGLEDVFKDGFVGINLYSRELSSTHLQVVLIQYTG